MKFGVDLITFFHGGFWNVASEGEVIELAGRDRRAFWDKMLDSSAASGVTGIELTFAPFDWHGALAAYGSIAAFAAELKRRDLTLASGFFAELDRGHDLGDPAVRSKMVDQVRDYARFLSACGADVMVMGMPTRQTPGGRPVRFVDLDAARPLADLLNQLGAATLQEGVRLALHTEAHSWFCLPRDVDLFLLLTDPAFVWFCPDSAHLQLVGAHPLRLVGRHIERVAIAHWKDAVGAMPIDTVIDADIHNRHRPYFCPLGQGRTDWRGWADLLAEAAGEPWAILELDAVEDPVGAIRDGRVFVEAMLEARP